MKIVEIEWLKVKGNLDKMSQQDIERLTEIGVFRWTTQGYIDSMHLPKFVQIMEEVAEIVNSYREAE